MSVELINVLIAVLAVGATLAGRRGDPEGSFTHMPIHGLCGRRGTVLGARNPEGRG